MEEKEVLVVEVTAGVTDKCMMLFVVNVVKIAKCLLDRAETEKFFAVIVLKRVAVEVIDHPENLETEDQVVVVADLN